MQLPLPLQRLPTLVATPAEGASASTVGSAASGAGNSSSSSSAPCSRCSTNQPASSRSRPRLPAAVSWCSGLGLLRHCDHWLWLSPCNWTAHSLSCHHQHRRSQPLWWLLLAPCSQHRSVEPCPLHTTEPTVPDRVTRSQLARPIRPPEFNMDVKYMLLCVLICAICIILACDVFLTWFTSVQDPGPMLRSGKPNRQSQAKPAAWEAH